MISGPERPTALLFISPGCPHCPVVLSGLMELLKEGAIASLEAIDVTARPERAAEYGVRSAPWLRVGPFTLTGSYSKAELALWVQRAATPEGMAEYLRHLLLEGQLDEAEQIITEDPTLLEMVLPWVADTSQPMQLRIGATALFESQAETDTLKSLIPRLSELTRHETHQVRSDGCHLLGLCGIEARGELEKCLADPHGEVREIAEESLNALLQKHNAPTP